MPTYEYACDACGHEFEEFQSITASALRNCPACRKPKLRRLISPGAGVLFKGSGFYETDYRSESYRKAADAEKKAGTPAESKSDAAGGATSKADASKPATAGDGAASAAPASKSESDAAPSKKLPRSPARKKSS